MDSRWCEAPPSTASSSGSARPDYENPVARVNPFLLVSYLVTDRVERRSTVPCRLGEEYGKIRDYVAARGCINTRTKALYPPTGLPEGVSFGDFDGGYAAMQNELELAALICVLLQYGPFRSSLDIGVGSGGSTRMIRDLIPIEETVVIDDGSNEDYQHWVKAKPHIKSKLTEIIGDSTSREVAQQLADLGKKFDLIAIDGAHDLPHVMNDWNLVAQHAMEGAIVWFHDIVIIRDVTSVWKHASCHFPVIYERYIEQGTGAIILLGT